MVTQSGQTQSRYSELSITDPGNADLAITVGSHSQRKASFVWRLLFFIARSNRRRSNEARLVGSGGTNYFVRRRIGGGQVQRAGQTGRVVLRAGPEPAWQAPHVSGAIAAFLSVRSEFIGEPERVKELFMANTIDLRRGTLLPRRGIDGPDEGLASLLALARRAKGFTDEGCKRLRFLLAEL